MNRPRHTTGEHRLIFRQPEAFRPPTPEEQPVAKKERIERGEQHTNKEIEEMKQRYELRKDRLKSIYERNRDQNPTEWDKYWKNFKDRYNKRIEEWNAYEGSMTAVLRHMDRTLSAYEQRLLPLEQGGPSTRIESQAPRLPPSWKQQPNMQETRTWLQSTEPLLAKGRTGEMPTAILSSLNDSGIDYKEKSGSVEVILKDGRTWQISLLKHSDPSKNIYLLQLKDNPDAKSQIAAKEFKGKNVRDVLDQYSARTMLRLKSENADAAGMKTFDLDKKNPTAYVELADLSDPLVNKAQKGMEPFSQVLASRYNIVIPPGKKTLDLSVAANAEQAVNDHIQQLYESGVRNFYINVLSHGNAKGFLFGKDQTTKQWKNVLSPDAVKNIFQKYPDCTFMLNTIACHGAGMTKGFDTFKDHKDAARGRVVVTTQTKQDAVNFSAAYGKNNDITTRYITALSHYLINGDKGRQLTYGEAHLRADKIAKETGHSDAGAQMSNPEARPDFTAEFKAGEQKDEELA